MDVAHDVDDLLETIQRLRALLRANLALTDVLDRHDVLQTIVDVARDLADAEYAALGVLSEDGQGLAAFIHSGMSPEQVERIGPLPRGRGLLRAVIVSGQPIQAARIQDHPASVGFPEHHPPMESFLGVPLAYRGQVLGNLYLTNKRSGAFTETDLEIVTALSAQAAIAIENARVITRERELVEQLRAVDQMKTDFVSMVSHELRTPLVALRSGAELLDDNGDDLPDEDRREVVQAMRRQATELHRLINGLLDLSQIDQGRLDLRLTDVELEPVVAAALAASPLPGETDLRIRIEPGLRGRADELYLQKALEHLLHNAWSYGAGPVTVAGRQLDDGHVELRVCDEGPGIPSDFVPVLFDRFTRAANSQSIPGSGLGLALVAALIEAFGGSIRYEDGTPRGAEIVVTLAAEAGGRT